MLVRELKDFLADKDDLSEIIVDTFEIQNKKTSIFPIRDIFEQDFDGISIKNKDIIIVL